mgnify:CR=1 FL=1
MSCEQSYFKNRKAISISSAYENRGVFYDIWTKENKEWTKIEIKYNDFPGRDDGWVEQIKSIMKM